MENEKSHHIQSYFTLGTVLTILLALTTLTVIVAGLHLGAFSVAAALLVASVKAFIVLSFFMHLKYESLFIRLMVAGVFLLFAIVIVITFIDYLTR